MASSLELDTIRQDLADEQDTLEQILRDLSPEEWSLPTSCPGWSVADQVGHLSYFDRAAAISIGDPERFGKRVVELVRVSQEEGASGVDELTLSTYREMSPDQLLESWRDTREQLRKMAETLSPEQRIAWYGPPMGALSFLTARLMETWTHAQDIVAAAKARYPVTDRLRHIAHLGYRTRNWSYINRGLSAPETEIFIQLNGPGGENWEYGNPAAPDWVKGNALEFCLVVTRRIGLTETGLTFSPGAREWLEIAQAFAGPPA